MRLPRVSYLFASPARRNLLLCLVETIIVATGAWVTHCAFGKSAMAAHDSATGAFAVLFAWASMILRSAKHCNAGALSTASAWVLAEAAATMVVKWMHPEFQPSFVSFMCWSAWTCAGVIVCRARAVSCVQQCAVAVVGRSATNPDDLLAIDLAASPLSADARAVKTLFDFVFAACALLAIAPVLLTIALAVRISSPGPVLFTQRRRGANGEPFDIYKFRTMRLHDSDEGVLHQAMRDDPRVTRVGAFLRRTSLDELPQFLNVLRGEMSVVGPRPHAIEHDVLYETLVAGYIQRYRMKPGITGWAQVNGLRGETDSIDKMKQRVEHDLYYLGNWSFRLDVRIVLLTVLRGFVHANAY